MPGSPLEPGPPIVACLTLWKFELLPLPWCWPPWLWLLELLCLTELETLVLGTIVDAFKDVAM